MTISPFHHGNLFFSAFEVDTMTIHKKRFCPGWWCDVAVGMRKKENRDQKGCDIFASQNRVCFLHKQQQWRTNKKKVLIYTALRCCCVYMDGKKFLSNRERVRKKSLRTEILITIVFMENSQNHNLCEWI